MELLVIAIIIGLVVYGLEHNRACQAEQSRIRLAGSSDVQDRDTERVACELRGR